MYPETTDEFKKELDEMYVTFLKKKTKNRKHLIGMI